VLVALIGAVRMKRLRVWRRREWQIVALIGALGVPHLLIAWHGDGMEVTRHASVANLQLRLGVIIGLVLVLGSRRKASAGADPLEHTVDVTRRDVPARARRHDGGGVRAAVSAVT
jgi:hypothetical protein